MMSLTLMIVRITNLEHKHDSRCIPLKLQELGDQSYHVCKTLIYKYDPLYENFVEFKISCKFIRILYIKIIHKKHKCQKMSKHKYS